jgi:hypothetical protein
VKNQKIEKSFETLSHCPLPIPENYQLFGQDSNKIAIDKGCIAELRAN